MTDEQQRRIAYARQRLVKIDQWLHGPADSFGECDECHGATIALWEDLDSSEPDCGWSYCRECWRHRADSLRERLKLARTAQ